MALKVTNLSEIKDYESYLEKCKIAYEDVLDRLLDTIKFSAIYWQGEEGNNFRDNLYSLIGIDLNCISTEMKAEIEYLNKLIMVLENAQEQIRNRLN